MPLSILNTLEPRSWKPKAFMIPRFEMRVWNARKKYFVPKNTVFVQTVYTEKLTSITNQAEDFTLTDHHAFLVCFSNFL